MTSGPLLVGNLLALLEAQLPARISAAGQPAVNKWLAHDPGGLRQTEAPVVWALCVDVIPQGVLAAHAPAGLEDRLYRVIVGVTARGADADAVTRAVSTYRDLIIAVLQGDQTGGGTVSAGGGVVWEVACKRFSLVASLQQAELLFQEAVGLFEIKMEVPVGVE